MLAVTEPWKMRSAALLLVLAVCLLVGSWLVRSEPSGSDCAERFRSNETILRCVAEEGEERSRSLASWVLAILGVGALAGAVFLGGRAVDRVMSLSDAAERLQVPVTEVRSLIERGELRPAGITPAKTWLRADDVSRIVGAR